MGAEIFKIARVGAEALLDAASGALAKLRGAAHSEQNVASAVTRASAHSEHGISNLLGRASSESHVPALNIVDDSATKSTSHTFGTRIGGESRVHALADDTTLTYEQVSEQLAQRLEKEALASVEPKISKGIPQFTDNGFLQNGIHLTTWSEMEERFVTNSTRAALSKGMLHAVHDLHDQGINEIYLGGSFVTRKALPRDFDLTYTADWDRVHKLNETMPLLDVKSMAKDAYGGEIAPNLRDFFRRNRDHEEVGILKFDLTSLPPRPSRTSPMATLMDRFGGRDRINQRIEQEGIWFIR